MNPRFVLALGIAFFMAGMGALAYSVTKQPPPAPAAPQPLPAPTSTPAPAPAPSPAPAPAPGPAPVVPAPAPPAPAPASAPPADSRPMRPELGLSVSESSLLNGPIDLGSSSIGVAEKAPKVAGLQGGSPASRGGIKTGDRIFAVDGHSVDSVAAFEAEMAKKTIPGEVVLRVGATRSEASDIRIVFK